MVMMFGLKKAPATFQHANMEIFVEFIPKFMQVFLDDFAVFSMMDRHLDCLSKCLQHCRDTHLKLNPAKCAFAVSGGQLLGYLVRKQGIAIDPAKVEAVLSAPPPTNVKDLMRFRGQVHWHSRVLRYLAYFAQPLHLASNKTPYQCHSRGNMKKNSQSHMTAIQLKEIHKGIEKCESIGTSAFIHSSDFPFPLD